MFDFYINFRMNDNEYCRKWYEKQLLEYQIYQKYTTVDILSCFIFSSDKGGYNVIRKENAVVRER